MNKIHLLADYCTVICVTDDRSVVVRFTDFSKSVVWSCYSSILF